jgi:hypothetical protein
MLQHNAAAHRQRAHLAHAAVVGLHAVCCGLPALALLAAAAFGTAAGTLVASDSIGEFHGLLHRYEGWGLALSAALVGLGGWLEMAARRHRGGFPWLFAFSALCLGLNLAIVLAHRAA